MAAFSLVFQGVIHHKSPYGRVWAPVICWCMKRQTEEERGLTGLGLALLFFLYEQKKAQSGKMEKPAGQRETGVLTHALYLIIGMLLWAFEDPELQSPRLPEGILDQSTSKIHPPMGNLDNGGFGLLFSSALGCPKLVVGLRLAISSAE